MIKKFGCPRRDLNADFWNQNPKSWPLDYVGCIRYPEIESGAFEWKSKMLPLHQYRFVKIFLPTAVLETATFRLEGGRSIQLSQWGSFLNYFLIFFSLFLRNFKKWSLVTAGFEPAKLDATVLKTVPFDLSGKLPVCIWRDLNSRGWRHQDLSLAP